MERIDDMGYLLNKEFYSIVFTRVYLLIFLHVHYKNIIPSMEKTKKGSNGRA
jgi:hypothetical protein